MTGPDCLPAIPAINLSGGQVSGTTAPNPADLSKAVMVRGGNRQPLFRAQKPPAADLGDVNTAPSNSGR